MKHHTLEKTFNCLKHLIINYIKNGRKVFIILDLEVNLQSNRFDCVQIHHGQLKLKLIKLIIKTDNYLITKYISSVLYSFHDFNFLLIII